MPPVPAPPGARLLAAVVVVVLRCFNVLPPPAPALRGADNLLGEREPLPTDVELAGAGWIVVKKTYLNIYCCWAFNSKNLPFYFIFLILIEDKCALSLWVLSADLESVESVEINLTSLRVGFVFHVTCHSPRRINLTATIRLTYR